MDSKDILVNVDHEVFQPFCDDDIIEIKVAVSLSREQWRQVYRNERGAIMPAISEAVFLRLDALDDEGEFGNDYDFNPDDEVPF